MAQKNSGARRRFARIVSICGLFLLSLIFASLPVAADKHGGGGDHGSGGNVETTSQKHDGDNHGQAIKDNDANDQHDMVDNDANEHHDMMDNDDNGNHDANDDDANDNDDDDAPPVVMPAP